MSDEHPRAGEPVVGRVEMDELAAKDPVRVTFTTLAGNNRVLTGELGETYTSPGSTTAHLPTGDERDVGLWVVMDSDGCLDVFVRRGPRDPGRGTWGKVASCPLWVNTGNNFGSCLIW